MKLSESIVAVCSICREPLSPRGVCLCCLLRAGLEGAVTEEGSGEPPMILGDFAIARREDGSLWELGRGAMGVTYLAEDNVLHRNVALKVIDPRTGTSEARTIRDRFLREARAAASLRHPNVAGVFQFGVSDHDLCYCAMELVDGETLATRVRREGPLRVDQALEIGAQVARALVAASAQGLVHRDLKPGNIMLSSETSGALGEVKVIDFGLAAADAERGFATGTFVGTPSFASPEQFRDEPVDARTDVYSLGVTLWFALTGSVPFSGGTIEEQRRARTHPELPVAALHARQVPAPVIALLLSMLAIDPANRPASARDLLEAIDACREKPDGSDKIKRRNRRRTIAGAFALISIIALAYLAIHRFRFDSASTLAPLDKSVSGQPTADPEARLLYLRALERTSGLQAKETIENYLAAEELFVRAAELDRSFALSLANASRANSWLGVRQADASRQAKARVQAERAVLLDPKLGAAHVALGLCLYWADRNYPAALQEFSIAALTSPNDPNIYIFSAGIYRRQGRWREALAGTERALRLEPDSCRSLQQAAINFMLVRDWAAESAVCRRELELVPDSVSALMQLAYLEVFQRGDLAAANAWLQKIPPGIDPLGAISESRWDLAMLGRNFDAAEKILNDLPNGEFPALHELPKEYFRGCMMLAKGETDAARKDFEVAAATIEDYLAGHQSDAEAHSALGFVYACLGRKDDALHEGRRAVALDPEDQNAFHGSLRSANLAMIYARTGEVDQAVDLIERLLRTPGAVHCPNSTCSITLAELRLRWEWDPLRSHPHFQRLLAAAEPRTEH